MPRTPKLTPHEQLFDGATKKDFLTSNLRLPADANARLGTFAGWLRIARQTERRVSKALAAGWLISETLRRHPVLPLLDPLELGDDNVSVMLEIPKRLWDLKYSKNFRIEQGQPTPVVQQAHIQDRHVVHDFAPALVIFALDNHVLEPDADAIVGPEVVFADAGPAGDLARRQVNLPESAAALLPHIRYFFADTFEGREPARLPDEAALLGLLARHALHHGLAPARNVNEPTRALRAALPAEDFAALGQPSPAALGGLAVAAMEHAVHAGGVGAA